MIKFRQKNYTIPEGHYTGPKDTTSLPGTIELVTKGAIGGTAIGGVVGAVSEGSSVMDGMKKGSGIGAVAGLLYKLLINYSQKPMNSIKYQEVDKAIRQRFGVFRISGVTVGDSIDKRDKIENKFSFNDRDVAKYKINIAICDNKFMLYTFGMTKAELDNTSNILDYYCKKYYGMEYDAKVINPTVNSYSVAIIFTNIQAVCDFIMELSNKLETKINFLDSRAIVLSRLEDAATNTTDERAFSVSEFSTFDLIELVTKGVLRSLVASPQLVLLGGLLDASQKLTRNDQKRLGLPTTAQELDNKYLEQLLHKLHYVENFDYTVSDTGETNMSLNTGLLFVTTSKTGEDKKKLESVWYNHLKTKIHRVDNGKVIVYTYQTKSQNELKDIVNKLMSCGVKINLYNKSIGSAIKKFRI